MGSLPEERLKPAPIFHNTSLDLFGPFHVKAPVKRRTELEVYGVIFTCMVCRAVYLDIAEGYDTQFFGDIQEICQCEMLPKGSVY